MRRYRDALDMREDIDRLKDALRAARQRIAEVEGERDAWRAFAEHQEFCSTCGEDGVRHCYDGRTLQDAARRAAPHARR